MINNYFRSYSFQMAPSYSHEHFYNKTIGQNFQYRMYQMNSPLHNNQAANDKINNSVYRLECLSVFVWIFTGYSYITAPIHPKCPVKLLVTVLVKHCWRKPAILSILAELNYLAISSRLSGFIVSTTKLSTKMNVLLHVTVYPIRQNE